MSLIRKNFSTLSMINFVILLLFGISYGISSKIGIDWVKMVPGILLIYYLPGHNLNYILLNNRGNTTWQVRLSLDILCSITTLSIIYLLIGDYVGFVENRHVLMVFLTNFLLALTTFAYEKRKNKIENLIASSQKNLSSSPIQIKNFILKEKSTLIIISIPLILFGLRLILNPYIFDIDSLIYYDAYTSILETHVNPGRPFLGRELFPFLMMTSNYTAGLGYIAFFKFFSPLVFYFSSLYLFALFADQEMKFIFKLSFLLILSSPMLTIAVEGVRPETYSIIFAIPVLAMSYLSIKNNDKLLSILALILSIISVKFHETGFVLLAVSMLTLVIIVIKNFKLFWRYANKNIWLKIIILLPYIILLREKLNINNFVNQSMITYIISNIKRELANIKWDWWFIDDATAIGGAKIGWPGYSAILYYLYDGIILLILAATLLLIAIKVKKRTTSNWLPFLPLFAFFIVHFSLAEILPRLGIVIMPNRSWPHIMIVLFIISIIFVSEIYNNRKNNFLLKWGLFGIMVSMTSGIVGATIGSTYMGAMVLPQEKSAIQTLRELPKDSIVVSPQRNHNLVKIYGNKPFIQLENTNYNSNNFIPIVKGEIDSLIVQENKAILDSMVIKQISRDSIYNNNTLLLENILERKYITDEEQKISLLKEFGPKIFDEISEKRNELNSLHGKKYYFLYSFAKLDNGIMSTRQWWRESSDIDDYDFFKNYSKGVIKKNDSFILIKIN